MSSKLTYVEFSIDGPGASPAAIDVDLLLRLLSQWKTILGEDRTAADGEQVDLALTSIHAGSAKLGLGLSDHAFAQTKLVTLAMRDNRWERCSFESRVVLRTILAELVQRNWGLSVKLPRMKSVQFSINAVPTDHSATAQSYLASTTHLFGTLLRLGGDPPKLVIALDVGDRVELAATKELACKIAPRLYSEIGLEATYEYCPDTGARRRYVATRILGYCPSSDLESVFRELRRDFGEDLNQVDPREYVRSKSET